MSRRSVAEIDNISEAYEKINLEILRPLAKFISPDAPTRKTDIVPFLTQAMTREDMVRRLYESLGEVPKAAIQEAVANPLGEINIARFVSEIRPGCPPEERRADQPVLNLFFPAGWSITRRPASNPREIRA